MPTGLLGFNPYGGGTVLDISSKPTELAIQQMHHEQAKSEALDKYFMDLDRTVNTAGVQSKDQKAVLDKLAANRDLYFKNKEAIKNPSKYGPDVYNQYMNNYRDALNYVEQSKKDYATQKAAQNLINQAKQKGEVVNDDFVKDIANNQHISVADIENYKPLDVNNFSSYIPHNDFEYSKLLKTVKLNPGNQPTDYSTQVLPDNRTQINYSKHYPDIDELKSYSTNTLNNQNPKIAQGERVFANALLSNPTERQRLADIYKQRTGQDMELTPEGIHLAHSISLAPITNKEINREETPAYLARKQAAETQKQIRTATTIHNINKAADQQAGASTNPPHPSNVIDAVTKGNINYGIPVEGNPNQYDATDALAGYGLMKLRGLSIPAKKIIYDKPKNKFIISYPKDYGIAPETLNPNALQSKIMIANPDVSSSQKNWGNVTPSKEKKPSGSYEHIQNTNVGELGFKNGKWYFTKTGKEYK